MAGLVASSWRITSVSAGLDGFHLAGRECITCVYTLPSLLDGHFALGQANLCWGSIAQIVVLLQSAKLVMSLQSLKLPPERMQLISHARM